MGQDLDDVSGDAAENVSFDYPKVVEDANLVAFLSLSGMVAVPFVITEATNSKSSRVAWTIQQQKPGQIEKHMADFYLNVPVGVRDFVNALKAVRTEMYNIKQLNNQLRKEKKIEGTTQ